MKLFRPLRKLMPFLVGYNILEEYDIVAPNTFRKYFCIFTCLLGYGVLLSATVLVTGFLVFEAETFEEFSENFYEFATTITDTFYFISMHWVCKQFFELNDHFEKIIKKREIFSL